MRLWVRKSSNKAGKRGWITMCVERASEAIWSGGKLEMRFAKVGRLTAESLRK